MPASDSSPVREVDHTIVVSPRRRAASLPRISISFLVKTKVGPVVSNAGGAAVSPK